MTQEAFSRPLFFFFPRMFSPRRYVLSMKLTKKYFGVFKLTRLSYESLLHFGVLRKLGKRKETEAFLTLPLFFINLF